jgi:integrase
VNHTLQRLNGQMQLVEPKTDRSRRTVSLPAIAIAALLRHREAQAQDEVLAGSRWSGNPLGLVFTSSLGTPLDARNVLRMFQALLADAKIPKMRIHDLRHSAASILIAQGVSAKAISELLGHSAVAFTLQVYGHLMEDTRREVASRMDDALSIPVATSVATKPPEPRVN